MLLKRGFMQINKLDLLSKGWSTSEIDKASRILEKAEDSKHSRTKLIDRLLLVVLGILMLINGFVCSVLLVPFIYAVQSSFIVVIVAVVGFVFSALFTLLIYDIEKIHHKHETDLFIAFIVNGLVNFYFLLEFSAQFGARTKLPLMNNIYIIAGTYLLSFLIPHIVYQLRKGNRSSEQ